MSRVKIEKWDKFIHKRLDRICVVNFVSVNGDVNYRIKFQRHSRTSTEKNFLKNWTPLARARAYENGDLSDVTV